MKRMDRYDGQYESYESYANSIYELKDQVRDATRYVCMRVPSFAVVLRVSLFCNPERRDKRRKLYNPLKGAKLSVKTIIVGHFSVFWH